MHLNTLFIKKLTLFIFSCICIHICSTSVVNAQNPSRKPPINKKQSKKAGIKQLFKGYKSNKRKKKGLSQKSNSYSGNNIQKTGPSNKSKSSKPIGKNKILSSKISKNRGSNQSRKSFSYSGTNKGKPKKGLHLSGLGGPQRFSLNFVSPRVRKRRRLSSRSLSFSGETISKPTEGQLAKKDRRMNKKAREGMYVNHTKQKRLKSNLSYNSLKYDGSSSSYKGKSGLFGSFKLGKKNKNNDRVTSTRVKIRTRPVANKMTGKKGQRLPRMSKKRKSRLKYDKKEREIWAK